MFPLDSLWPHRTLICTCMAFFFFFGDWSFLEIYGCVQDTVSGWVFFLGNVCVLKGKGVGVKAVRRAVVKFP